MKTTIMALAVIALTLTACSSKSGRRNSHLKQVRVQQLLYNPGTNSYSPLTGIKLRSVDTLYKTGDTISLDSGTFVILP